MVGSRRRVVSSLLGATILLGSFGAGAAFAAGPPAGPADDAGTQAMTTQATVDRAKDLSDQAAAKAATSAAAAAADPGNVDKAAAAAADAAAAAVALEEFGKETKSLAGVNGGIASDAGKTPLADVHFSANNPVKSDNLQWIANSRGLPASNSSNANYAGATFMHFENLGYDFMLGDGTGGLSIFSLKNPENPTFVGAVPASALMQPADAHGTADTAARFYEGENPTVDSRRKLAFLARDPRSFGNSGHPHGRTGLYIIDVKDPWNPQVVTYHWVPAGHTATCINDCRYLWSVGPANNGSQVSGQPQDVAGVLHPEWTGVPAFVTDVRDTVSPVHVRQAGRHQAQQRHDRVHPLGRRRSGRPGLDVRLRRRPRLLHHRHAHRPDHGRGPLRLGDRPGPVRGRQRPDARDRSAVRHGQHRAQLLPRDAGGLRQVPEDDHHGGRSHAQQDRPAVRHAGERHLLHLDERRRLRSLRDLQPRRQL